MCRCMMYPKSDQFYKKPEPGTVNMCGCMGEMYGEAGVYG